MKYFLEEYFCYPKLGEKVSFYILSVFYKKAVNYI